MNRHAARTLALSVLLASCLVASAQPASPRILKIDPPNWWARMPSPMLLMRGENLTSATFRISDSHLRIQHSSISANGHWAELWLSASPFTPERVTISVRTPSGTASAPYSFDRRRAPADGFAGFSSRDVMYLIMTDRFADGDPSNDGPDHPGELARIRGWHGGDLRGIQQHLDYLQQLGITTVWITPVSANLDEPDSYHGYGATDMYSVDPHFGSLRDLRSLSAALHGRGMKLVLDTVPNHVGPAHPWVHDSPEPTWFHGTFASHHPAVGEFLPLTDPHAPVRDQRDITEGWFANILPDMNQENPAVSQYLIQNAVWWTEVAGLDGLRIDTFPYVGRPFWHSFHQQLHSLYPHLTTVGEIFNGDAVTTSSFAGGVTRNSRGGDVDTGLDTPFDFPTYFALRDVLLHGKPMTRLTDVLRLDSLFPHPERLVPFLGNHDTPRFLNDPAATPQRLQLAFAILATMRGMPQIYSGDEIAMRGGDDPDNRRDFPGGFSPGVPSAFTPAGRTPEQQQTFAALQSLLSIRSAHPALQSGSEQVLEVADDTLAWARVAAGPFPERILVAVNKADSPRSISFSTADTALSGAQRADLLSGPGPGVSISSATLTINLPSQSFVIARID